MYSEQTKEKQKQKEQSISSLKLRISKTNDL